MFPDARGVPAVGLTRMFCQVSRHVTPLLLALVTVKVICEAVTELTATEFPLTIPLILRLALPPPVRRVIKTVGAVPPMSNSKPVGAFKMIVPVPTSPEAASSYDGPVNDAKAPPVLSAEMADPPLAGVIDTAATVMNGLVFAVLVGSVMFDAVIVWDPAVFSVTEKSFVPPTKAPFAGRFAAPSEDVIPTVFVELTRFQLASTAFTVTRIGLATA